MSVFDFEKDPRLARLVSFYEQLSLENLSALSSIYTSEAFFKDPFQEVKGHQAIEAVFQHMYATMERPYFRVLTAMAQNEEAFLRWHFYFCFKRNPHVTQVIEGSSYVRFAPDGRVEWHRDYWDAAEELYEKIPLLGSVMRGLKRMARS